MSQNLSESSTLEEAIYGLPVLAQGAIGTALILLAVGIYTYNERKIDNIALLLLSFILGLAGLDVMAHIL